MEDILAKIIADKKKEVADKKTLFPEKLLEQSIYFDGPVVSLKKYIQREDKTGIIAEFKRKSPSKGFINQHASVERTSIGYMQAGASALSILTDGSYFGGSKDDLVTARKFNFCPILRKDFIVDEYQILEARSMGADAVLLIAAALTPTEIQHLASFAKSLGLEVLMEVHNEGELENNLINEVDLIGVNNRNLKTFVTDIAISEQLVDKIPSEFVKVSESGLSEPETVVALKAIGYEGFLIGGFFMENSRPERACEQFIHRLEKLEKKNYSRLHV
ncbi:MAG: indole-3-glycerol phosphate synthase TrpC [Cyclobacteriaceae bacterium]|nr:indole-3-glycerol phosphate synthase TrpC [Cyclobacteriaceae bacterium]MCH8516966.1 indole-3-glycerol phosphate synthase TrpC [Cyclobacteriaceae bacterium]